MQPCTGQVELIRNKDTVTWYGTFHSFSQQWFRFLGEIKAERTLCYKVFLVKNVKNKNENTQLFFFTSILGGL